METILRGFATYLFVWVVFRVAGKRTLAQITTFDAVLLLIISETTQSALLDDDNSMTGSFLLILTLLGTDVLVAAVKQRAPSVAKWIDGKPLVLVDPSGIREEPMKRECIDREDILAAARHLQGIASMEDIDYAVLENSGGITIIPKHKG